MGHSPGTTGYRNGCRCVDCRAAHAEESRRHRAKYPQDSDGWRRRKYAERVAPLKAKPCTDCGGTFPPECMDFDHRPGEVKVGQISHIARSNPSLLEAELAKCDLVCANCHRIRTKKRNDDARRLRLGAGTGTITGGSAVLA